MKVEELSAYLNRLLSIQDFSSSDVALNGLQIGNKEQEVTKIAFCVDASLATLTQAANLNANMMIVHHGLFWGKPLSITGAHYKRVKMAIDNNIALYAAHLPLDAHPLYGNNAQIASALSLKEVEPFGLYHGKKIGFKGILPEAKPIEAILSSLQSSKQQALALLPFGKKEISSVAIVSGGAANNVHDAITEDIDCYITGEPSHTVYHDCKEANINLIALGHYHSEIFGVKALEQHLKERFNCLTVFIDLPTQL